MDAEKKVRLIRLELILLLGSALISPAQSRTATVYGIVEQSGKRMPGLWLQLVRQTAAWHAQTVTDNLGGFGFAGLDPGTYSLRLAFPGSGKEQTADIQVLSASRLWVHVDLHGEGNEGGSSFEVRDEEVWWGTQFTEFNSQKLPNEHNLWSLLQNQEGSIVTNRLESGGLDNGEVMLFGAVGASWTENQCRLDGLNVTDPYTTGLLLINPDVQSDPTFPVITAAKPATSAASGTEISLAIPAQSSQLHGATRLFYSTSGLQSDNRNGRLKQLDLPLRLRHLAGESADLGGKLPLRAGSLPFFVAFSGQQLSQTLGGFAAPIDSHTYRGTLDVSPVSQSKRGLDLLYSGQQVFNSRQGAMPNVSPAATTRSTDNFHQFLAAWNESITPAVLLTTGAGVVHASEDSAFQPGVQGISTIELPERMVTGPAPLALRLRRTRYQTHSLLQAVHYGPLGAHSAGIGFEWDRSHISNTVDSSGGATLVLVQQLPTELVRWDTPTRDRQHVQNVAGYVQDSWRPLKRLSLPIGLRVDTSTGRAEGQPTGISWTAVQPRAGLLIPLGSQGPMLQASWSRYGHSLQGRYLDFGDPAALGGQILALPGTSAGAAGLQGVGQILKSFGGPHSLIDPRLLRPFTDEISFGMQQELPFRTTAAIRFFRRDDHRLIAVENVGVPFSEYSPVLQPDPGNDGILGTRDDQLLVLFNENQPALGHDLFTLANPPHLRASFKGFEARLLKRLQKNWEFSATFTAGEALAVTSPGNSPFTNDTGVVASLESDPNTLVMARGRTYFDRAYTGKLTAYYSAPRGFRLGVVTRYYDGLPFARLLFINGFNQGPFFVRATPVGHPGGFQTQLNSTLDVRLARDFDVRRGAISAYVDAFNLLNSNSNTREAALTSPAFLARVPVAVQPPRTMLLGFQWQF